LFYMGIDLDKKVRKNHPLRKINEVVDFDFVYSEVKERCRNRLRSCRYHKKTPQPRSITLYFATDSFSHYFRENAPTASTSGQRLSTKYKQYPKPIGFIRFLTGH
jgi:hypothetical protein